MKKRIAQNYLMVIWVIFTSIAILMALTWDINNYFGTQNKTILTWLAQCSLPYMLLILSSHLSSNDKRSNIEVDFWKFSLSMGLSVLYFLFVLGICFALSRDHFLNINPLPIIDNLSAYSTFFQSALAIILGLFFVATKKTKKIP